MKATVKTGDEVLVISGDDKGKQGKVLRVIREKNRVVVSGVNVAKKHVRKNAKNPDGAILEIELPIDRSNVRVIRAEENSGK